MRAFLYRRDLCTSAVRSKWRQASNCISCLQTSYLHFDEHVGLHEAGCGHEEGGVGDSARSGDDLPATAMDRLVGDHRIKYFELAIPDWLFAKRALSRSCEREEYVLHEYLNKRGGSRRLRQIPCLVNDFLNPERFRISQADCCASCFAA